MKGLGSPFVNVKRSSFLMIVAVATSSAFFALPVKAERIRDYPNCDPTKRFNKTYQILRNVEGNRQWTRICNPNVKAGSTIYPIQFQDGDRVWIRAGGCAQTGGRGKTWKRYVNPSGSKSDRYYHGQIAIPGAISVITNFSALVASDQWSSSPFIVRNPEKSITTLGNTNNQLILGYSDDGYGDNGYWEHDEGTGNQCLNTFSAYVDIWVERK